MLSHEENQLLTQTNKGTPMGELFRSFWIPALTVDELPVPDCPPVRVKLLGEYLVAFRTTDGEVALVEEYCPHRKASLYFGRNEENGIRCVFHGWKFDKTGKCVETPSEPPGSRVKEIACLRSYPCKEYGGIIWTYMGDPKHTPEFPEFSWGQVPHTHRIVTKWHQRCNYVQGIEANMDSSHLSFLHGGFGDALPVVGRVPNPRIEAVNTDYGLFIGAARDKDDGNSYWRFTHFVDPCITLIAGAVDGASVSAQMWVPMDDENCYSFAVTWDHTAPLDQALINKIRSGAHIHARTIPGTLTPELNIENEYKINRELQKSGYNYTGIFGFAAQDAAVIESTRGIPDRTTEILGMSDVAIIQMRRRLMRLAKTPREERPKMDGKFIGKLRAVQRELPTSIAFSTDLLNQAVEAN